MRYNLLNLEKRDRIAILSLNRPECQNALSFELLKELTRAAEDFRHDTETRVVIFTGSGKNFSVGVDLKEPSAAEVYSKGLLEIQRIFQQGPRLIRSIYEIDQITIAAINGYALGGGACISTACDFRIGSENCEIGYPECGLGMNLNWVALPLCVHLIGPSRAKQMVILARRFKADQLLEWGFLDRVVPDEQLLEAALEMAGSYAAQSPIAAQMIKRSVNQIVSALDQAVMHMDRDQFILSNKTEDFIEGISAFLGKRPPEFKGK